MQIMMIYTPCIGNVGSFDGLKSLPVTRLMYLTLAHLPYMCKGRDLITVFFLPLQVNGTCSHTNLHWTSPFPQEWSRWLSSWWTVKEAAWSLSMFWLSWQLQPWFVFNSSWVFFRFLSRSLTAPVESHPLLLLCIHIVHHAALVRHFRIFCVRSHFHSAWCLAIAPS